MPEAKRVSWAQLKVGIMAAVALVILMVLIFLLTGSGDIFTSNATLYTYMDDAAAMAPSTIVRLNGISVGKIEKIGFSGETDPKKIIKVEMSIRSDMLKQIPDDSKAGVSASNLLGDKFINITKGKKATTIKDHGVLESLDVKDIPELVTTAGDLLTSFQQIVNRFSAMLSDIEAGRGNIGKFVKDEQLYNELNTTIIEARRLVTSINNGRGILPKLINDEQFAEEFRSPVRRVDSILAGMERGEGTLGKLAKDPALFDETRATIADIRRLINIDLKQIVDDLNAGKGTAGKLLKDEEFYRRANQLITNLNTSIDKLNSGQGTLGQLIVNQQLYDSMNGATRELQGLLKDIRSNPKKFLRIKLGLF